MCVLMIKTRLTPEDRHTVWRAKDFSWLFYAWRDGEWCTFPVDPRRSPTVMHHRAGHQENGCIERRNGFVVAHEVRDATPEDEAELLARYGKTADELADEAEAGYDPSKFVPYSRKTNREEGS